ncbi:MAG: hypothetical protein QM765_35330 [Myxococcales bacterium]
MQLSGGLDVAAYDAAQVGRAGAYFSAEVGVMWTRFGLFFRNSAFLGYQHPQTLALPELAGGFRPHTGPFGAGTAETLGLALRTSAHSILGLEGTVRNGVSLAERAPNKLGTTDLQETTLALSLRVAF